MSDKPTKQTKDKASQTGLSATTPNIGGSEKKSKSKRKPFCDPKGIFNADKIKRNLKMYIKKNERFAQCPPQISRDSFDSLAVMALDLSVTLAELAKSLSKRVSKSTVGIEEIKAAVKLHLRGDLQRGCIAYIDQNCSRKSSDE
ncbi:hypothetical protein EDEG_01541 [Edhazardia aedis USNM 41457]|uniref:Histone H2A/H2B/H3 domain-containing protein n=1 Tax=Edhazardia aedis (strain USNM 41457) TaxID=1003232 RepID=J9D8T7_EDHAE|nr:hypothetical protein EDEG_01541 [Edhazardia aedis USNM 41457]|eukprot:EJW04166.1 hypothetical protein EDEG_01541 [Edhazardia aedis USNM 41457]